MQNVSLKIKKLDQDAIEMFISEFAQEKSLQTVISKIYKNYSQKNESFKRSSELFGMSGK